MPDRRGRRPAASRLAHAADPAGAEGSHRAVFWIVRADGKGDVVHRTIADRGDHGDHRKPEGGTGRTGAVFRRGPGTIAQGAVFMLPRHPPDRPTSSPASI